MKWIALAFALAGTVHASAEVIATVGSAKITKEDFTRRLEDLRRQAVNPPGPESFLEDVVRFEMGVQEAEKEKLQNDPVVKERIKQVLYNSLLEKQIGKKVEGIEINEKEMKAFYKKNPELRLAHILIDLKSNATADERAATRKRAGEILEEVKKSKRPFEELVKLYSDDATTKEMGGDIGFQSRVTLMPAIYDAAMGMKAGEIKGLIETRYGFHILKLIDRRSYEMADKRQIRAAVFDEKRAELFNEYFARLKKSYRVEVNQDAVKSL